MCGIVVVVDPGGPIERELLATMRDRLLHRGVDGAGLWTSTCGAGGVGLGHRRLAILDLTAAAAQPMTTRDGRFTIVFNGEIYNFVELRAELEQAGIAFETRSDTEVLLQAFVRWGERCLERLNGMFAFAIWDELDRTLFVARDRFGEKPLFWTELAGGGVAIASEIKALLAHPRVTIGARAALVADFAAGRYREDGPDTMFEGVLRLPPAHAMVIDGAGRVTRTWRWWVPDLLAIRAGYRQDDAVEQFRHLLAQSVRLRLRADVPVGSSLSGGLDSSSLVCLLARERHAAGFVQKTFSARFDDDPTISEGDQIDQVVRHAGAEAHAVRPDPEDFMRTSRRLHWHQEEPFLSASIFLQWCVARLAREQGTTILIDGQGADELLGGYQSYFHLHQLDLADRGQWGLLAKETAQLTVRLLRAALSFRDVRRRFDPLVAFKPRDLLHMWLGQVPTSDHVVGVPPPVRGLRLRTRMAEALQYNNLPTLLRYADRNAMAFGREPRLPFLDRDLVDFCLGLPDEAFVAEGWQKLILRRAGEGVLPPAIQWRADKVGYVAPQDRWLRGPLRGWAEERLFEGRLADVPGYSREQLSTSWQAHLRGEADHSWAIWRWVSLSEWLALLHEGAWSVDSPRPLTAGA
jgi:asparagine synthase (glutamine-hydrolysing)